MNKVAEEHSDKLLTFDRIVSALFDSNIKDKEDKASIIYLSCSNI